MKLPSSVGTSFLAFGAVLTALSPLAGALVAFLAVCWEVFLFVKAGLS